MWIRWTRIRIWIRNTGLQHTVSDRLSSYFPQIRALQKTGHSATHPALAGEPQPDGVPPGYELVSLVEALNEPLLHAAAPPPPLQLFHTGDGAAGALAAASGGTNNKKRSKRRGSKDPQHSAASSSSRDHRGTRVGEKGSCSTSPPPVEDPRQRKYSYDRR
jgi:hypothetical protein